MKEKSEWQLSAEQNYTDEKYDNNNKIQNQFLRPINNTETSMRET